MSRVQEEKDYWNNNAKDSQVDLKYISDISTEDCLLDLQELEGKTLEIGCGVGRLMKKGYYGIDISEEMLKIAKERRPDCNFKLSDGRTIPYADETFDSVYSYLVFQHLPLDAVESYIKEAHRVLKKNGLFVFQWIMGDEDEPFSKHHSMISIIDTLSTVGFGSYSQASFAYSEWTITTSWKI